MTTKCPLVLRGCRYSPPFASRHHIWWPHYLYRTPLEKRFRNHPDNVEIWCRCLHDLEHCKRPPKKPSHGFMKRWLTEH